MHVYISIKHLLKYFCHSEYCQVPGAAGLSKPGGVKLIFGQNSVSSSQSYNLSLPFNYQRSFEIRTEI